MSNTKDVASTSVRKLRIYNTMTRVKEPFETIEPGNVRMYVCGVTPYASAHVGHGMSAIVFDVIKRYLEHAGFSVRHAQNFTDIDDKIISRANAEGIDPNELTESLIAEWHKDTQTLGIKPATIYPRATLEVPNIISMIERLVEQDYAYHVAGDVYFRVRSFPYYGKLSQRKLDDLLSGARIEVVERKDDPLDFALWKSAKPGEPFWESPWGPGRPGWHIECSAMCSHHLDGFVDIHGGGADLIFPHHENEIAQSEAFLGAEPFARYWVHNGLLQLSGDKMSKSIGNIVQLRDVLSRGLGPAFRLMVLQSHYRAPLSYSDEALQAADRGLDRLRAAASVAPDRESTAVNETDLDDIASAVDSAFHGAMDDDFDTATAVAQLFELARSINRARTEGAAESRISGARFKLIELSSIIGLSLARDDSRGTGDAKPFIDLLVEVRDSMRAIKQWALADQIRDRLIAEGITIADGPTDSTWRKA